MLQCGIRVNIRPDQIIVMPNLAFMIVTLAGKNANFELHEIKRNIEAMYMG